MENGSTTPVWRQEATGGLSHVGFHRANPSHGAPPDDAYSASTQEERHAMIAAQSHTTSTARALAVIGAAAALGAASGRRRLRAADRRNTSTGMQRLWPGVSMIMRNGDTL